MKYEVGDIVSVPYDAGYTLKAQIIEAYDSIDDVPNHHMPCETFRKNEKVIEEFTKIWSPDLGFYWYLIGVLEGQFKGVNLIVVHSRISHVEKIQIPIL